VPLLPPTHVIFDLDGTLVDTEPLYTLAAQAVVGRYGKVFDWKIKRQIMGGGPLVGARFVVEHLGLPISPEDYLERREAILRELCTSVPAMPGAQWLVDALQARGIPMAVGTSSTLELCQIKLSSQPFAKHFAVTVCSDDPEVHQAKPAPDIFLVAAARMGANPARCLVFEDTTKGAQAAHAAGMQVIAVPDPHMRSEDFSVALCVVDSLEQVTLERLGL
jgi:pseudouridine-5'-monophosphatase